MEALVDLLLLSLSVSVQLGVPLVVLFVAGYMARRKSLRLDPRTPTDGGPGPTSAGWITKRVTAVGLAIPTDWTLRHCPPVDPARVDLPCWQAVKTAGGRLRSECVDCSQFLTQ